MKNTSIGLIKDYMYQIIQCILCLYTGLKIRKGNRVKEELNYGQQIWGIISHIIVYYWAIMFN